mgnify:FL=1|jgi:hypothetical protein
MKQANLMYTHSCVPVQSYIISIIEGIKGITMPQTAMEPVEETTRFEDINHALLMRLSHKMDSMDKPARLKCFVA